MTSRHDTPQPEDSPPSAEEKQQSLGGLWWNTNIPQHLHTEDCPSYLLYAFGNNKDRAILETSDNAYRRQTWPEVQQLIRQNRLEDFTRVPSELRAYREFCRDVTESHGSVLNFISKERLGWKLETEATEIDLEDPSSYNNQCTDFEERRVAPQTSYKILRNDWPYGFDPRIVHLVVWTKFSLPVDPDSDVGDMSAATKEVVESFVEKTFSEVEEKGWFKNWSALKSVHAVEHFHVLLFEPTEEFVRRVTA